MTQTLNDKELSKQEVQPIRFQGQFYDEETGLHYNRFRYYDNDVGMFISRDPIELDGGFNVFAYAPNPVSWVDPLGLYPHYHPMGKLEGAWNSVFPPTKNHMLPCPKSPPIACTNCTASDKWRKYGGNPNLYHCGFNGFLENRIPDRHNFALTNECFYDHSGNLVDENHEYKGCRGTPDEYPYFKDESSWVTGLLHLTLDSGGTLGHSDTHLNLAQEGSAESNRFFRENPEHRPPNWVDPALPDPMFSGPNPIYGP